MKKLLCAVLFLALTVPAMSFAADLASDPNYKGKCAGCHGANGEGKPAMKTKAMKDYAAKGEDELMKSISDGVTTSTPKMPGYKDKLTADQIKALVAEIKAAK